jgi:predicted nucleic acid-binding protein
MNVLIDTNLILDVAMARKPFFDDSAFVIDAAQSGEIQGWIAWHTVSNLYYIFSSTKDDTNARAFIRDLLLFINVIGGDAESARRALALNMADYEDALQCVCGMNCGAELIITRNIKDFRQSPIRVITPAQFRQQSAES